MSDSKKVPLTQQAYDKLTAELDFLEGERRQKIVEAIAAARAHGDLSENAEYHAAREDQGRNEDKIRRIKQMIENAEIIDTTGDDDGVARPGKLVTIRYEGDDEAETYLLGMRAEAGEHDSLTPESPIGSALIGHRKGETVVAKVPAGELKVEILEVRRP
ncbi:MAG: transcription elongation factor GreA [Actinomycetota bacterium]